MGSIRVNWEGIEKWKISFEIFSNEELYWHRRVWVY